MVNFLKPHVNLFHATSQYTTVQGNSELCNIQETLSHVFKFLYLEQTPWRDYFFSLWPFISLSCKWMQTCLLSILYFWFMTSHHSPLFAINCAIDHSPAGFWFWITYKVMHRLWNWLRIVDSCSASPHEMSTSTLAGFRLLCPYILKYMKWSITYLGIFPFIICHFKSSRMVKETKSW